MEVHGQLIGSWRGLLIQIFCSQWRLVACGLWVSRGLLGGSWAVDWIMARSADSDLLQPMAPGSLRFMGFQRFTRRFMGSYKWGS